MLTIKFKLLREGASLPIRATKGSAAIDFYWCPEPEVTYVLRAGTDRMVFTTGVAAEIPPGYCLMLRERSSLAAKGIFCVGGLIDADYRGEIKVILMGNEWAWSEAGLKPGDRVAQGLLLPVPEVEIVEVTELSPTMRAGGFGSTGR